MLVYVKLSYVLKGYAKFKANGFSKKFNRQEISLGSGGYIICDEYDVCTEIEKYMAKEMLESKGWGTDFEGWNDYDLLINKTYIKDLPMHRIIDLLTGEQFRRFMNE